MAEWMIYGAYGYTGALIAEEAVRRGHKPVLAGRSEDKLKALATRLDLPFMVVDLHDSHALARAVANVRLVLHAAGPFIHTSEPMIYACLAAGTHYLDITGEVPVFENTFRFDTAAVEKGIALISGVGFDVVPTDCMARYIAEQMPHATHLEIAFDALQSISAGTMKSMIEQIPGGGKVRLHRKLVSMPFGRAMKRIRFSHGEFDSLPITWGDLATAYRTTNIPNIITFMALTNPLMHAAAFTAPLLTTLLKVDPLRQLASEVVTHTFRGPDEHARMNGHGYIWVRAADAGGASKEAWLETCESYQFTRQSSVLAVERVLADESGALRGALTPACAFGTDFVLEIEGTKRMDALSN